ncbi:G-protein beta WD-40 repeats containing protein [Reticulomyxa filosa]|uniref:G-protein beta WD-40 repeats containing protein n=1 Tax=Reticulomyxa filosa TaxID=46433 RepID=X6P176_RETFI|nr:G-protein beta WD-40 repeats containing protein [Reticulomyxa filosa]|eukprot:ETO31829.1 G-protein beta WD-40 repeats containing protein [Reticulomyxa filosa]
MITLNEKETSIQLSEKEETQIIIQYWIRILKIKLGWIHEFDKLVVNYVMIFLLFVLYLFIVIINNHYLTQATTVFMLDTFRSSSKLLKTFSGHTDCVYSIDCFTLDCDQFICSGSDDKTVRVWDVENNKQIQSFNGHSSSVSCVKFSPYHCRNYRRNVICSASHDKTIRFWDIKDNQQWKICKEHTKGVCGIEFSQFNRGRYLCSASDDKTIRLWDIETYKSLHVFNGHEYAVWCIAFSSLQSYNNKNKNNSIGVIGGNGYTICSGSSDRTIRVWDIETTKQLIVFKGHRDAVVSVKYGSNELGINGGTNTILSGSQDNNVCLWDIRSKKQTQVFKGHRNGINIVEYSSFVMDNNDIGDSSNIICSGSSDNTIRFWDIRSNKELHVIKENNGIHCLTFLQLKKEKKGKCKDDRDCDISLCYCLSNGTIHTWG